MIEFKHTDHEVKNIVMGRRDQLGEEEGCLLTAYTNIFRLYYNNNKITPVNVDDILDKENGYTRHGYIIHKALEKGQ